MIRRRWLTRSVAASPPPALSLTVFCFEGLADRLGERRPLLVLAARTTAFLLAYCGFALSTTDLILLAVPFPIAGIGVGCAETAQHSAVATLAPPTIRGSAFGLLATIQAIALVAIGRTVVATGQPGEHG